MILRPPKRASKHHKGTMNNIYFFQHAIEKRETFETGVSFNLGSIPTAEAFARIIPFSGQNLSKYSYRNASPQTATARAFALSFQMSVWVREAKNASYNYISENIYNLFTIIAVKNDNSSSSFFGSKSNCSSCTSCSNQHK